MDGKSWFGVGTALVVALAVLHQMYKTNESLTDDHQARQLVYHAQFAKDFAVDTPVTKSDIAALDADIAAAKANRDRVLARGELTRKAADMSLSATEKSIGGGKENVTVAPTDLEAAYAAMHKK